MFGIAGRAALSRKPHHIERHDSNPNPLHLPCVHCTIVCDVSDAMVTGDRFKVVQEAVSEFVEHTLKDFDRVEIVTFSDQVKKRYALKDKRYINIDQLICHIDPAYCAKLDAMESTSTSERPDNADSSSMLDGDQLLSKGHHRCLFDAIGTTLETIAERDLEHYYVDNHMMTASLGGGDGATANFRMDRHRHHSFVSSSVVVSNDERRVIERNQQHRDELWLYEMFIITCGADNCSKQYKRASRVKTALAQAQRNPHLQISLLAIDVEGSTEGHGLQWLCDGLEHVEYYSVNSKHTEDNRGNIVLSPSLLSTFKEIRSTIEDNRRSEARIHRRAEAAHRHADGSNSLSGSNHDLSSSLSTTITDTVAAKQSSSSSSSSSSSISNNNN